MRQLATPAPVPSASRGWAAKRLAWPWLRGIMLCILLACPALAAPLQEDSFVGARGLGGVDEPPALDSPYRPGSAPAAPAAPAGPGAAPSGPAAQSNGNLDLLDRGEFAAAGGRFEEAERLWRQALAQRPDWGLVKQRLAELPSRRARFGPELAEQNLRREARLAMVEGVSFFNARQYQEAAQHFRHYLAVFPDDIEVTRYLEMALAQGVILSGSQLKIMARPDAQVFLDGRPVGRTPLVLPSVEKGPHRLEVRAYGASQQKDLVIKGGGAAEISFVLLGGALTVNARPWGEVSLDGELVGQTPLSLGNLVLGRHQVTVRHPAHPAQTQEVLLEAGREVPLFFELGERQ